MAVTVDTAPREAPWLTRRQIALGLFVLAVAIALARPLLPGWMVVRPEEGVLPLAPWLDAFFNFVKDDLGLIHLTRGISGLLEYALDTTANLLEGKRRWPNIGPIPWPSVAAVAAVTGYWLGGWRMALIGGGTFVWVALIGQWDITMQTLSVIAVAAPVAFFLGLGLGMLAWKYPWFDRTIKPVLAILQTLPFFTYLLPAVIFFKVGPTAGCVATIVYAIPPMVLMTTVGLRKVPPEVVEAGKMAGCTRLQMMRHVYVPAARTEILIGLNQIIMLCLAMVVLTVFIGMPGLGAKLMAMMNSFKLGRSFEIGVTIVLLAVMLDRLSRAWVLKQPEHFEKGTPWWQRHAYLVAAVVLFAALWGVAHLASASPDYTLTAGKNQGNALQWFWSLLDEVGRRQDLSVGREIDDAIKSFLAIDSVQAVTGEMRTFLIQDVLIPFRNALLWLPNTAVILAWAALGYFVGGMRLALLSAGFFVVIALTGWWDRSIITLYAVIASVVLAALIGLPLGIWAVRGAAPPLSLKAGVGGLAVGLIGLAFKRVPIVVAALLASGLYYYFAEAGEGAPAYLSLTSVSLYLFALTFLGLWLAVRHWPRDKVMITLVDTAQTFPSFVYLIPAIMLFGINDVAVVFSILIYTLVPMIRYTIEGLRAVPPELTEAADMAGATRMQKLWNVQLPLALPTMAVGFNQAIMFAFFMVIIAAFIGTQDLGQELQRTLAGTDLGKNFVLGMCVVLMALVFDNIILRWSNERRKALGLG